MSKHQTFKPLSREERVRELQLLQPKVEELKTLGAVSIELDPLNVGAFAYTIQFKPTAQATVTIMVSLKEWQTTSDVVITNLTTLPETERRKGYASQVVQVLISWARKHGMNEIRATQVGAEGEGFWQANGFVYCSEPNETHDFLSCL